MADIIIVRSNSIVYSPRVVKIGMSLRKKYPVLVLGWNRENLEKRAFQNHDLNIKLFGIKAPLGKYSLIGYLPFFWIWILANLIWYKPIVVHACDLDTVIPCFLYKVIFKKKLVFDVCDRYGMAYIPPTSHILYYIVNRLEEMFVKKADVVVTVAEPLLASFPKRPKKTAIIMNCSNDTHILNDDISVSKKNVSRSFKLVYTGNIVGDRGLDQISKAINDIHDVEFIVAGHPIDEKLLDRITKLPNIIYKGRLQHNDALKLTMNCDAMVILYDPRVPNNNFSSSNKLFEAMMCKLPIITNVSSEIVNDEVGCGIIVDYDDVNAIRAAIIRLKDNLDFRTELGNNGRKAFQQKYNWRNMEKKLYGVYEELLPS